MGLAGQAGEQDRQVRTLAALGGSQEGADCWPHCDSLRGVLRAGIPEKSREEEGVSAL